MKVGSNIELQTESQTPPPMVSFRDAVKVWAMIGWLSFGGPAGQIALMHRELVEKRRWIDEGRFLHALNYCMLLPGPEAQQLATYIGWLMHRTKGGITAGLLFVLPGFIAILALSILYATLREVPAISGLFFGLKAAVFALVVEAVLRIGKRAIKSRIQWFIAATAFVAIFFLEVPFPWVIIVAAISGLLAQRLLPAHSGHKPTEVNSDHGPSIIDTMAQQGQLEHTVPSARRTFRVIATVTAIWVLPIVLCAWFWGTQSVWVTQGIFFSQTAVVTFGGAYAVLAYVAQRAVDTYGWLLPGEMLDGLGLAETTPGPLIMVVQFVGFLGAYRHPGTLDPLVAGCLGSLVTVWVTFAPCFLWIFVGAPYIEALRGNKALNAALSAITAAVVGVILNLSVWFGLHVLFHHLSESHVGPIRLYVPSWPTFDPAAFVLTLLAVIVIFRLRWSLPKTLLACALCGLAWTLALS
ncbi:MAG: chromate efflux transporter [Myxococcales bacterium]|nr:chromate efflux transporter [Myxococcales bacterium]